MYEALLLKYRLPLVIFLIGLSLLGVGLFIIFINNFSFEENKIEVIGSEPDDIVIEIVGEVNHPGIYSLIKGSRVEDALKASGGLTSLSDLVWISNNINRAAKLMDGQKINIPKQSNSSTASINAGDQNISSNFENRGSGKVNLNTSSLKELDTLPGIGLTYGQNIIEQRPYSSVEELLSRGVLKSGVYKDIKDLVTVY